MTDKEYLNYIRDTLHHFCGTKIHVLLEDNHVNPCIDRDDALSLISNLLTDLETHIQIKKEEDKMNDLKVGEIIQIKPDFRTKCFAACLAVVSEPKSFGAMVYIQPVGETFEASKGQCYLRLSWDDFEITGGRAPWVVGSAAEEENDL